MRKALPKGKEEKKVKKKPVAKHGKKKTGAGGKNRYDYPADKKKAISGVKPGRSISPPKQAGEEEEYVPPARQPQQLPVDLNKLCSQLGCSKGTLVMAVSKCAKNPKLKGKIGFVSLMGTSKPGKFSQKHGLDASYWSRVYDAVVATTPNLQ